MTTTTKSSPIAALRDALAASLLEREREAELLLLGVIAREHVLIVGPPGTAKSAICRNLAQLVDAMRYFERLMSPTTPPENVWGPISLSALRQDRYEHITAGYAADAHLMFLDEVGRMSPAIGDSMLHLLGPERQALVGTQQIKAPLVCAIGAANTWPEDAALLDRWLLRATVKPISKGARRALVQFVPPPLSPLATLADLDAAHAAACAMPFSDAAYATLDEILADLDEIGVAVSDRRLRAAGKIARAAAVLRGGTSVEPIDLEALQYVLWSTPDQSATASAKIVARANPLGARLDAILGEVDEIVSAATDKPKQLEAVQKLDAIAKETKEIVARGVGNGRAQKVAAYVQREQMRVTALAMGIDPAKMLNAAADVGALLQRARS